MASQPASLRSHLAYEPKELSFGTSGRRGDVAHLTQLEIFLNVTAELEYLASLPPSEGGLTPGGELYFAYDLRPSSSCFVGGTPPRGEICQAVVRAALCHGLRPVNLGRIPSPALACYAISRCRPSVMVTGSHIPFELNGYKLNTSQGELRKEQEIPIGQVVQRVRQRLYAQPFSESLFNEHGMFKTGHTDLPPEIGDAAGAYQLRYREFFRGASLTGKRIMVYQHSAVGRDLLVEILQSFGAEVIPMGRSETFVPIDTENLEADQLSSIQALATEAARTHGPLWAVVSTDGDSDRPLVLGVDSDSGAVRFYGGDLVGMIVARFLGANAVVVPISCNDAIDRGDLRSALEPKTKIGSPYVIAGLEAARKKGRTVACGWEANGGFLTGSPIERHGQTLSPLPTRDAILPILCVLLAAEEQHLSLAQLFAQLPTRYSRAALLKRFPRAVGRQLIAAFSPQPLSPLDFTFGPPPKILLDGIEHEPPPALHEQLKAIRDRLHGFFRSDLGFAAIARLNYIDGVRMVFSNEEVAHIRPSGNADELRIYAVAGAQDRADAICRMAVAEPDGLLRAMEKAVSSR